MKGWGNDEVEEKTNGVGEIRWSCRFFFLGVEMIVGYLFSNEEKSRNL